MTSATEAVLNFRVFLNAGYSAWRRSAQVSVQREKVLLDEAFSDWAQANWELLVERPLCAPGEYLELYAAGSDYEAQAYSRVFFHEALPTHEIACESADGSVVTDVLSGLEIQPGVCSFDRLVSRKGSWYADEPPFDHVLLEHGDTEHLVPVTAVTFVMRPIGTKYPLQPT